jgi:hypothetical protein
MGGPVIIPIAIGTVSRLAGVHLGASAVLEDGALSIRSFEVAIARRAEPGVLLFRKPGGPMGPRRVLRFATIDGRPAEPDMSVGRRRPIFRLNVSVPIERYAWRLTQNGRVIEERSPTSQGISEGGRCITITPTVPLLRLGRLPAGYFFPPFATFTTPPRGYQGRTYGTDVSPSGEMHSPFAIDFNRGQGPTNRGDPVLAAQPGRVIRVSRSEAGKGTVWIRHRGDFMTQYTHMTDIPERFGDGDFTGADGPRPGAMVALLDEVGRIGDVGAPDAFHLHHRHHHRKVDGEWQPVQMSFGKVPYELSRAHVPPGMEIKSTTNLRGWTRSKKARMGVTVQFPDGREARRGLSFTVSASPSGPAADDPGCGVVPIRVAIGIPYEGAELPPGDYVVRYRATDDRGQTGPFAFDESLTIVGP